MMWPSTYTPAAPDIAPMDVSMRSVDSLDRSNRAGLAARWGHTNQLFCHRSSRPTQPAAAAASAYQHTNMGLEDGEVAVEVAEQTVPVASGEISSFEWEAINPMVRPVLKRWHDIFSHLQSTIRKASNDGDRINGLHQASMQYRSELRAALQERAVDEALANHDMEELQLYEGCCAVWHLCEIFFLDPSANITAQMVSWLHSIIPSPDSTNDMTDSELRWAAIHRCTIQGRVEKAIELLRSFDALLFENPDVVDVLCELLQNIPSLGSRGWSLERFSANFTSFQANCRMLREQLDSVDTSVNMALGDTPNDAHIRTMFDILCGSVQAMDLDEASWIELVVGRLLFRAPYSNQEDVRLLAEDCLRRVYQSDPQFQLSALDACYKAVMDLVPVEALMRVKQEFGLTWITAHLADLLHHAGKLRGVPIPDTDLREACLAQYGESIMASAGLWEVAVTYFSECRVQGTALLTALVDSQSLSSDRKALRLLELCDRKGLTHAASSVRNQLGRRCYRQRALGSAIHWYISAKNTTEVARIAEELLWAKLQDPAKSMDDIESVTAHSSDMSFSPSLACLARYQQVCALRKYIDALPEDLRSGRITELEHRKLVVDARVGALGGLVAMLRELAPRRMWPLLLLETVPLLEALLESLPVAPAVSAVDTHLLMRRLEEVTADQEAEPGPRALEDPALARARLCFLRNLSAAVISAESH